MEYIVQSGDTLSAIAKKFGVPMEDIVAANGITNPNNINIGQVLIIPCRYTVQSGDTLSSIARRFGTTVTAIMNANGLTNANNINIGQVLIIPGVDSSGGDDGGDAPPTFTRRTEAPTTDNPYYYRDNPFYQAGWGLPNCTCYAWGRFWEATGIRPKLSTGNAEDWYDYKDGYKRGQTPKIGAIICWRKGAVGDDNDGAGHVEFVEAVNTDGTIITTGSGYNSFLFREKTRSNDGNWGQASSYVFQGFIYSPVDFGGVYYPSGDDLVEPMDPTDAVANAIYIWNYFIGKIGNANGVAGMLGNLYYESGLHPDRVQGDIPYSEYSQEYTAMIDMGEVTADNFIYNGPGGGGYGLAQWTFHTRKRALWNLYKTGIYWSIGSIKLACDYLWYELQNDFPGVLSVLKSATSVRAASDKFLHDFENPADQSVSVEIERANKGQEYYDLYKNGTPDLPSGPDTPLLPDTPHGPIPWVPRKKMSFLLLAMAARRK